MKRLAAAALIAFVAALSVPGARAADRPTTPTATIAPCGPDCSPQRVKPIGPPRAGFERPADAVPTLPPTDTIR